MYAECMHILALVIIQIPLLKKTNNLTYPKTYEKRKEQLIIIFKLFDNVLCAHVLRVLCDYSLSENTLIE
jgi:hypothetical protein